MSNELERANRLLRVLGDELRRARTRQGWTRKELLARLDWDSSLQTLATYELGTRALSATRLVDLADALKVPVADVLMRAMGRFGNLDQAGGLEIDLRAVVTDQAPEIAPLRRWAHARLRHTSPGGSTSVRIDQPAIVRLAELCGLATGELAAHLWSLAEWRHPANDGQRTVITIESASACHE